MILPIGKTRPPKTPDPLAWRLAAAPTDVTGLRKPSDHDMVALPVGDVRGSGVFGDNVGIRWKILTAKDSRPRRVSWPSQRWRGTEMLLKPRPGRTLSSCSVD